MKKNNNTTIYKIFYYIKNIDTRVLFTAPAALGVSIAVLWSYVAPKINMPNDPNYLVTIFSLFMIGLGGFGVIIKKELPATAFLSIRGLPALIFGVVWILFWWGLALPGIWRILITNKF